MYGGTVNLNENATRFKKFNGLLKMFSIVKKTANLMPLAKCE